MHAAARFACFPIAPLPRWGSRARARDVRIRDAVGNRGFLFAKKRVAPRGRRYSDWVIYKLQVEVGGEGNVDQRDLVLSKGDLV